jgi:hypothetical protein
MLNICSDARRQPFFADHKHARQQMSLQHHLPLNPVFSVFAVEIASGSFVSPTQESDFEKLATMLNEPQRTGHSSVCGRIVLLGEVGKMRCLLRHLSRLRQNLAKCRKKFSNLAEKGVNSAQPKSDVAEFCSFDQVWCSKLPSVKCPDLF